MQSSRSMDAWIGNIYALQAGVKKPNLGKKCLQCLDHHAIGSVQAILEAILDRT